MNTYIKFQPNVFLAKCPEAHEKGATKLKSPPATGKKMIASFLTSSELGKATTSIQLSGLMASISRNGQRDALNNAYKVLPMPKRKAINITQRLMNTLPF